MQRCDGGGGGTDTARHGGHDTGDTETDLDGLGAERRRTLRHRPAELRWGHCITSYAHYATVLAFFLTAPRRESGCWEREITMTCPVLTREPEGACAKYTAAPGGTQPAWDCRLNLPLSVDILVTYVYACVREMGMGTSSINGAGGGCRR